ncbi:hypothetical protein ACLESD_09915 [Pyxidicoccus sp. 3LFB2]
MQSRKAVGPDLARLELAFEESARFAYQNRFVPFILRDQNGDPVISVAQRYINRITVEMPPVPPKEVPRPGDDVELGERASDFGVVIMERTRISPAGFALGEHLLSLSLAPGEEVAIEQKTYSERTVTYEDASEQEEQLDVELGSSFTTELSVALTRGLADTRAKGTTAGIDVGFSYVATVTASAGYSDSITSALTSTENETLRNVATKTEKLTSRRRAQHKISMKVSDTSRFETSNKRILRNPNPFTPIDLVYFKILQKLDISHERYGVRLAWAPFIRDPGVVLDEAYLAAKQAIENQLPLTLPALRAMPQPPPSFGSPFAQSSGIQELTNWGFWTDMRADYWFDIQTNQANFMWDGDESTISSSLNFTTTGWGPRGTPSVYVVRTERSGNGVRVLIHAGAGWGGGGAHLYIEFKARFIPDTASADAAYQEKLQAWQTDFQAWTLEVAALKAERIARIETALATWKAEYLKTFDPVTAAFQLLIAMMFPPEARDEGFEIETWNKIFDFENAAFEYYPSWWSNKERRNTEKSPDSFENASWMRVFLTIRPGFEQQALNLIVDRRVYTSPTDPLKAHAISKVLKELHATRDRLFGGFAEITVTRAEPCPKVERPYVCLGQWREYLPTDGTHLEVVQAKTTAFDDANERSLDDAHAMITARIGSQQAEGQLTISVKDKVTTATTAPDVDVHLGIGVKTEP